MSLFKFKTTILSWRSNTDEDGVKKEWQKKLRLERPKLMEEFYELMNCYLRDDSDRQMFHSFLDKKSLSGNPAENSLLQSYLPLGPPIIRNAAQWADQRHSHFFKLPRELRDVVYSELLGRPRRWDLHIRSYGRVRIFKDNQFRRGTAKSFGLLPFDIVECLFTFDSGKRIDFDNYGAFTLSQGADLALMHTCRMAYLEMLPKLAAERELGLTQWPLSDLLFLPRFIHADFLSNVMSLDINTNMLWGMISYYDKYGTYVERSHWKDLKQKTIEQVVSDDTEILIAEKVFGQLPQIFPSVKKLVISYFSEEHHDPRQPITWDVKQFMVAIDTMINAYDEQLDYCILTVAYTPFYIPMQEWAGEVEVIPGFMEKALQENEYVRDFEPSGAKAFFRSLDVRKKTGYWVRSSSCVECPRCWKNSIRIRQGDARY